MKYFLSKIKNILTFFNFFYYKIVHFKYIHILNYNNYLISQKEKKIISFQLDNFGQYQHITNILKLIISDRNYGKVYIFINNNFDKFKKIPKIKKITILKNVFNKFIKYVDINIKCNFEDNSPPGSISAYLGHGFPGKRNYIPKKYFEKIDHYFLYGPLELKIFKYLCKINNFDISKIKLWKSGYSNYDDQIKNKYNVVKIKKKLGINNKNKNILYSPSYEEGSSLRENFDKIVNKFSENKNLNFIIKLHPVVFTKYKNKNYTGGIDWNYKVSNAEKKYKNIYFFKDSKINPLFKLCDIMITDYSGVGIGFMIEKKPVIYLISEKYFSDKLAKLGFDVNLRNNKFLNNYMNLGVKVNNLCKINDYIKTTLNKKLKFKQKLKNFVNKVLYNPGYGALNTYKSINKILGIY